MVFFEVCSIILSEKKNPYHGYIQTTRINWKNTRDWEKKIQKVENRFSCVANEQWAGARIEYSIHQVMYQSDSKQNLSIRWGNILENCEPKDQTKKKRKEKNVEKERRNSKE